MIPHSSALHTSAQRDKTCNYSEWFSLPMFQSSVQNDLCIRSDKIQFFFWSKSQTDFWKTFRVNVLSIEQMTRVAWCLAPGQRPVTCHACVTRDSDEKTSQSRWPESNEKQKFRSHTWQLNWRIIIKSEDPILYLDEASILFCLMSSECKHFPSPWPWPEQWASAKISPPTDSESWQEVGNE